MPDDTASPEHQSPATPEPRREPTIWDPEVERLEEAECWRLISAGGVGRLAYSGRSGLAVLPVGYQVQDPASGWWSPSAFMEGPPPHHAPLPGSMRAGQTSGAG
jgi:hypothetical protein